MKKIIQTINNIWKIEELRNRILYTLGILLVYRLGSFIVLPGIDPSQLDALHKQTASGVMGLLDMFSGGAFSNASIFALGIMPYISASIVIQLMGVAVPYFQRLQKEGESGQNKINQITRWLTVLILLFQAPSYLANLHAQLPETAFVLKGTFFTISSVLILTSGTIFVMWLGERITDRGIGNGISLIIMIGIIARFPFALLGEFAMRLNGQGGLVMMLLELLFLLVVTLITIALVQAVRRIPVQYARTAFRGGRMYRQSGATHIPLRVNTAGMIPLIFAMSLVIFPNSTSGHLFLAHTSTMPSTCLGGAVSMKVPM
jgi:preprotein translocase subunit SecY